jgi:hypothetical protein
VKRRTKRKPSPQPSELLELLRIGRIPLKVYLAAKVAQSVAPFRNRLKPSDVAFLQIALETGLDSDPTLQELKGRLLQALYKRSRQS